FALLVRLFKYMCICGERFDLIVLHAETDLYRKGQRSKIEFCAEREGCRAFLCRDGGIHPLSEAELSEEEKTALARLCDVKINLAAPLSSLRGKNGSFFEISAEAEKDLLHKTEKHAFARVPAPRGVVEQNESGFFTERGFAVKKGHGGAPFATVAANEKFGFIATENSLGFSYFENSALGKLTPHTADAMREDAGERIILRVYEDFEERVYEDFDLCATASFAEFGENGARYRGNVRTAAYTVEVYPDAVKPMKKISVRITGGGELRTALFFIAVPCLGERPERAGRYVFEQAGKCIFAASVFENPVTLALASSAEDVRLFTDEAAVLSDGRIFCGGGDIAAICARGSAGADFYLAALTADFGRSELTGFLRDGGFRRCEPAPIFDSINIRTGKSLFDLSVNRLFPYQTYYSRFTARAGFYQVGGAYGFRDQLQDSLSFIENAPQLCREQILRCASHQYREGDVAHWWHVYAGRETGLRSRYSDDLLWLPFALCEYVEKTG
ncbi:MAG: hypothetical protein IJW21_02860, partial [Clostridia bacterium]|nr:hypothetical protein [Clostridia bacterium]